MKRLLLASLGLIGLNCGCMAVTPLQVGDPAPNVTSIDQNGKAIDLGEVFAKGTTLVYFYPKADTPGCTAQSCSLRDAYENLTDEGVMVIGVSNDSVESQKAFAEKHKLPFTLLSDKGGDVMKAFHVPTRFGFASRQAFLIRDGKVVWLDTSASTKKQAQDALAALSELDAKP